MKNKLLFLIILFVVACKGNAQDPSKRISICLSFAEHLKARVYLKQEMHDEARELLRICSQGKSLFFTNFNKILRNEYDTLIVQVGQKQQLVYFKSGIDEPMFESLTLLEFTEFKPKTIRINKLERTYNPSERINQLIHTGRYKWTTTIVSEVAYRKTLPPFYREASPTLVVKRNHPSIVSSSDSLYLSVFSNIYHSPIHPNLVCNVQSNTGGKWENTIPGHFIPDTTTDPCVNDYTYYFKTDSGRIFLPGLNAMSDYLQSVYKPITKGWSRMETKNRNLTYPYFSDSIHVNTVAYTDNNRYRFAQDSIHLVFNCHDSFGVVYNACWENYAFLLEQFDTLTGVWVEHGSPFSKNCTLDREYIDGVSNNGKLATFTYRHVYKIGGYYRFKTTVVPIQHRFSKSNFQPSKVIYTNPFRVVN